MWKKLLRGVGVAFEVIGWAGLPDDLQAWGTTVSGAAAWINHENVRTVLVVLGLVLIGLSWVPASWRTRLRKRFSRAADEVPAVLGSAHRSLTANAMGEALQGKTTLDAVTVFNGRYRGKVLRAFGSVADEVEGGDVLLRSTFHAPGLRVSGIENGEDVRRKRPEGGYGWMLVDARLAELNRDAGGVVLCPARVIAATSNHGERTDFDGHGARTEDAPRLRIEGHAPDGGGYELAITNKGHRDRFVATVVRCSRVAQTAPRPPWDLSIDDVSAGSTVETDKNETVHVRLAHDPAEPTPRTLVFPGSGCERPITAESQNHFEMTVVVAGTRTQCALEVEVWIEPNRSAVEIQAARAIQSRNG